MVFPRSEKALAWAAQIRKVAFMTTYDLVRALEYDDGEDVKWRDRQEMKLVHREYNGAQDPVEVEEEQPAPRGFRRANCDGCGQLFFLKDGVVSKWECSECGEVNGAKDRVAIMGHVPGLTGMVAGRCGNCNQLHHIHRAAQRWDCRRCGTTHERRR